MRHVVPLAEVPGGSAAIARALADCRDRACRAAERAGRGDGADVSIIAVTKYVDADVIRALWDLGVRDFGENRVQEVERKLETFAALDGARLHFIGHLQRNKVRKLIGHVHALHSLDSVRLLDTIAERCLPDGPPAPELWVEVNVAGEEQKTGAGEREAREVLDHALATPLRSDIRGLMTMAPHGDDSEAARPVFRRLRELRDRWIDDGLLPPEAGLSMGMSGDFETAIEEGATVVRIGSRLYEVEDS